MLNLETLKERRLELSLRFAKKCEKNPRFNDLFKEKIKSHEMELRKSDIIATQKDITTLQCHSCRGS